LPPEKVRVIPNAVELDTLPADPAPLRAAARSAWGVDASGFVVGIVANLRPVKRVDLFLKAAALVAAKVDSARFVIIGEGEERSALETLADDLGIADRVRFLGLVHDVSGLLHGFDVGVLSSDSESFSNAVLEYMAASRPVVATDVGALGEAVADGESGFLVKRADAEALAARIVELHDPAVASRLGRRGAEIVEERFSAEKIISEFEDLYLNIRSKR
jgi:glycosyltransferase involved in cell wall biosynthesis